METCVRVVEVAHLELGLAAPYAQSHEIRTAWRSKARETHPDHGGSAEAFRTVQLAAEILLAEGMRERYEEECLQAALEAKPALNDEAPAPPTRAQAPENIQPKRRRRPAFIFAAVASGLLLPHLHQLGITWQPVLDVGGALHEIDWLWFAGWLMVKKRG